MMTQLIIHIHTSWLPHLGSLRAWGRDRSIFGLISMSYCELGMIKIPVQGHWGDSRFTPQLYIQFARLNLFVCFLHEGKLAMCLTAKSHTDLS